MTSNDNGDGQEIALQIQPLGKMQTGSLGRVISISSCECEIERCLLEMGFVEGASVEVLHHGWLRRDPLAVRINRSMTVALRRCEADAVLVRPSLINNPVKKSISQYDLERALS
jgi:ferrous iron transport protein A